MNINILSILTVIQKAEPIRTTWIQGVVIDITETITNGILNFLMPFVSVGLKLNVDFWTVGIISQALTYSCSIATGFLVIKILKDIILTYNLGITGDPMSDPMNKIMKVGITIILIWSVPQIVKYAAHLGNTMVSEIGSVGASSRYEYALELTTALDQAEVFKNIVTGGTNSAMKVILIIIVLINYLRICYKLIMRTVELLAMALIGPFFTLSLAGDDYSQYGQWLKELGLLVGSHILQIILVRISLEFAFRPTMILAPSFFNSNGIAAYLFLFALTSFTVNIQGYVGKLLETSPQPSRLGQYAMTAAQTVRTIGYVKGGA